MEKKSNVGVVILVIVLMLICLCGGYFLSAKNIVNVGKKDKQEVEKPEIKKDDADCPKVEAVDVSSEEVSKLVAMTMNEHGAYCGFYKLYTDKKVTPKDLDEKDIARMVLNKVLSLKGNTKEGQTYTKEEFEDAAHAMFGKDFEFKHVTIGTCPTFTYDSSKGIYTEGVHACGGTCGPSNISRVVKAVRTDKGMDIYVKMLFIGYMVNGDTNNHDYYTDYKLTKKTKYNASDMMNRLIYEYDEITSQGSLYKISYAQEDNNYYLVSVEPVSE